MAVVAPNLTEEEALRQADVPGITRPMTYEEYMAGPEEMARYDIIDGWKVYRLYGVKQTALSRVFPELQVAVDAIFQE